MRRPREEKAEKRRGREERRGTERMRPARGTVRAIVDQDLD